MNKRLIKKIVERNGGFEQVAQKIYAKTNVSVTAETVRRWINSDKPNPTVNNLRAFCQTFKVDYSKMFGE